MSGPIEQFEIKPLVSIPKIGNLDISFTNSALFMVLGVAVVGILFTLALRKKLLIPSKAQSAVEIVYEMVKQMTLEMVGPEGVHYIPFIFSIFVFVVIGNLLGLCPYSFTYTSHFSAVGALSVFAILVTIVAGLKKRGLNWFTNFFPKGTPVAIAPILVPIEIISFCSKPFSLTVRLSVNMMVGHIMMKVIAGFVYDLSFWGGWIPLAFIICLTLFEMMIAVLQAYVYTILTCVYLSDAIHSH